MKLWKYLVQSCRMVHNNYVSLSSKHKYLTAMFTGGSILTISDCTAQYLSSRLTENYTYDFRRTLSLFTFGTLYYGFIYRSIYSIYDLAFGPKNVLIKVFVDCGPNTFFLLIPSFYYITGYVKGYNTQYITNQLKNEYLSSSFGTALYWAPIMFISFRYFTIHTRILYITICSFFHKTVLSWYSNRNRVNERINNINIQIQ
eukprot:443538_1